MTNHACTLRPLVEGDYPLLLEWWNDIEIAHLLGHWRPAWTAEALQRYFATAPESRKTWIAESPDDAAIGCIELVQWVRPQERGELRIVLGDKGWWRKGVAADLGRHALMECFSALRLRRVGARFPAYNERAARLAERIGMREEGRLRGSLVMRGNVHDEVLYSVLRDEFMTRTHLTDL